MGFLSNIAAAGASPFTAVAGGLGAGDLLGDMVTGGAVSNAKSVESTNAANFAEAQNNRNFQERMSNSAYQRAVEDMRKAGLNPALAYNNGGASTPSGAQATAQSPQRGQIGAGLFNTAKTVASEGAALQNTSSQTDLNKANAEVADVTTQKLTANAKEAEANLPKIQAETRAARAQAKIKENEAGISDSRYEIDKAMSKWDAVVDRIRGIFGGASSAQKLYQNSRTPPPAPDRGWRNSKRKSLLP